MVSKVVETTSVRNGHELAPLNTRPTEAHGVTIVVQGSRGSLQDTAEGADGDRAAWSGKVQFFLSIIGYSVGLGNIWRFPYLCQQNGGGAFLIPFTTMLILEGIPLFLIEMAIGQRMRLGSLGVWNTIHPWLGGIGISSCVVTLFVCLYYNVIITWVFFYLFNSLRSPLPWSQCPAENTTAGIECARASETAYFWYREALDAAPSIEEPGVPRWWIVLCLLLSWIVVFFIVMKGIQSSGKVVYFTSLFPYIVLTIFFFRGVTLKGAGAGIAHMYRPKVEKLLKPNVWLDAATQVFYSFGLAFGSLIAFGSYNPPDNNCVRDVVLVSVCNALTAIYASVVIFSILGFKAATNVDRCILSNMRKLFEQKVTSNLTIPQDEYDHLMIGLDPTRITDLDLGLCSMSKELNEAAEGTGLAFIVFTQAIVELPASPFWSLIFFLMLLSLGLGSQIGIMEGMLCTIFDIEIFKRMRKPVVTGDQCDSKISNRNVSGPGDVVVHHHYPPPLQHCWPPSSLPSVTDGVVCTLCFFVGLIFTTGAGEYWLKMFDSFAGTIGLVVVAFMEMISVIYVYGHEKFTNDIYEMTGYKPGWYWQLTWRFIGPGIVGTILISSLVFMIVDNPTYSAWNAATGTVVEKPYPSWVMAIAVAMILASILPIPIVLLLRRFQCLTFDVNIHQGSIRRIETTVSTKEMIDDQDVMSPDYPAPAELAAEQAASTTKFTIGDFDDEDSLDDEIKTTRRYDNNSSSDEDSRVGPTAPLGRLSMRPTVNQSTKFRLDTLENDDPFI